MSYYLWGPRGYTGKVVIAIGYKEETLARYFGSVKPAATVGTQYSMPDEHVTAFVCRDPRLPMRQAWPLLKVYR